MKSMQIMPHTATAPVAMRPRPAGVPNCCALLLIGLLALPAGLLAQETAPAELPAGAFAIGLDEQPPVSPSVTVGEFDNGIRYFIRENQEPENRAELRLVVDVGSVLEDDDQLGLAHFLEHMAFNGTENFEKQELIGFMESIGMRLGPGVNAYTSFDETVYQLQLPTDNPEYMATAFQILEDWAMGLTLDSEEIDLERGVVIEEWRLGQGAQARIRDEQFPVIFRDSRYAERLPIGTLESLENFDHDSLRRFYDDWYRPELMSVIAVGDFDTADIESLIQQHFEGIPASPEPRERVRLTIPEHDETLFTIVTDPELPITQVAVYHKMPPVTDWSIGGYRQRIVERLYNDMLNARFQEIARQPDPPFLAAFSQQGQLIRPVGVYILAAPVAEVDIDRGLETLLVEAERVARFGFTPVELERQKTAAVRNMERLYANRDSRNSGAFAAEYIRAYLNGESIPGVEYEFALYQRFVPEITLDEVNRIGQNWISDSNRVVAVTAPEKPDLVMPGADDLIAVMAAVDGIEITPYEETTPDQPLLANVPAGSEVVATRTLEGGITEWDLANGIKVVLKPTDFQQDQIVFRGSSPGGTSLANDEDYIPASTAVTIIANGGLAAFDATDLQRELTGKVANVNPFISDYQEGVTGNASPADLETMFQLIYLRMTAPRADETFYEIFRNQMASVLANRDANPAVAFGDTFNRIFYQDHLRRQPQTVEMIDETDLARSMAFYEDRFADTDDFTFIFVGNMDLEVMRPLVETYLGGLPATAREETWRDVGIRNPTGVFEETVNRGIEPQSRTQLAFTGPFDYGNQTERTRISATAQLLQTRLREVMREQLGGTYSVSVSSQTNWQPVESYSMSIGFGSDPERAEEMFDRLFVEIESLKESGPTAEEVSDTQQAMLRAFETRMEQNNFWLNQLNASYRIGTNPGASEILSYAGTVEALTPADIQAGLQQYFDVDNYIRVTLLPEE